MALIKNIKTERGPASFWVVALLQLDNFAKTGFVRLYGFFDQSFADLENAQPMHKIELTVPPVLYDQYFNPEVLSSGVSPHGQAYQMIKNSTIDDSGQVIDFSDAKDVF